MSRTLVIDGVTDIRSREAARLVQLAPDYVSRMARAGDIEGRQLSGLWFVNLASLKEFVADQERRRKSWYAELAHKRREEQILAGHPSALAA
jgi:hypothetical protein